MNRSGSGRERHVVEVGRALREHEVEIVGALVAPVQEDVEPAPLLVVRLEIHRHVQDVGLRGPVDPRVEAADPVLRPSTASGPAPAGAPDRTPSAARASPARGPSARCARSGCGRPTRRPRRRRCGRTRDRAGVPLSATRSGRQASPDPIAAPARSASDSPVGRGRYGSTAGPAARPGVCATGGVAGVCAASGSEPARRHRRRRTDGRERMPAIMRESSRRAKPTGSRSRPGSVAGVR